MTTKNITLATLILTLASTTIGAAAPRATHPSPDPVLARSSAASFEVANDRVTVRKDILLGRSITTLSSATEHVVMTIDRQGIVVTTQTGRHSARLTRPEEITDVVASLSGRQIVKDAADLLERQALDPASVKGHAFGLTRALLESVAGETAGTLQVARWAHAPTTEKAILAGVGSDPSSCWDAYARDAIRAAGDYVDCYNNTSWYDVFGRMGCGAIYDVEAEGDWIWYMNCVGLPLPQVRMG